MDQKLETVIYEDENNSIPVNIDLLNETAWFMQSDLAKLFKKDRTVISRQVKQISLLNNLEKESVCAKFARTGSDGKTYFVLAYNQDIVLELCQKNQPDIGPKFKSFINEHIASSMINLSNNIIYDNGDVKIAVRVSLEENTVWLTQRQIAELYDVGVANISHHVRCILIEGELDSSVFKYSLITAEDGKTYQVRLFNLDMIISIGYRIKSTRGIAFRKWANHVLKRYLINGYALDATRVKQYDENYLKLRNDVEQIRLDIACLKEKFLKGEVKECLFHHGEYFDAYEHLSSIIKEATTSVFIIDPYFDMSALIYLKNAPKNIIKTVCYAKESAIIKEEIKIFEKQYGKITLIHHRFIHDRFLIIDEKKCYLIGSSLNSQGFKVSALVEINQRELIQSIIKIINKE